MKALRYTLAICVVSAMSATALFAQRSSSAVQTVTFSVKKSHALTSLAAQQPVAEESRYIADGSANLSPANVTEGDPIALRDVKVSMSELVHSNSAVDVLLVAPSAPEARRSASTSPANKIVPRQSVDSDSSPFQTLRNPPSSDQVVLTITD